MADWSALDTTYDGFILRKSEVILSEGLYEVIVIRNLFSPGGSYWGSSTSLSIRPFFMPMIYSIGINGGTSISPYAKALIEPPHLNPMRVPFRSSFPPPLPPICQLHKEILLNPYRIGFVVIKHWRYPRFSKWLLPG